MPPSHSRRRRRSSSSHSSSRSRSRSSRAAAPAIDTASLWLVVSGFYWLMLVMAMHLPGDTIPRELRPEPGTDGTVHSIAYAGFAFLLCRTFDAWHRRKYPTVNPPLLFYVFIFISCITYAYIDEETQPLTGRSADPADWQADVFGAAFGCCCDLFLTIFLGRTPQGLKKRRRRRHRHRHRTRSESGEHRHRRRRRSNSRPSELPEVRPEEPNEGLDPGLA